LIYVPQYEDDDEAWVSRGSCVLDAPPELEHTYPLLARYKVAFTNQNLGTLSQFFGSTLAIETFSWRHVVEELKFLNCTEICNFDRVRAQYEQLDQHRRKWVATGINLRDLR